MCVCVCECVRVSHPHPTPNPQALRECGVYGVFCSLVSAGDVCVRVAAVAGLALVLDHDPITLRAYMAREADVSHRSSLHASMPVPACICDGACMHV